MGVEVLPPDINESEVDFTTTSGTIRFGLAAVKGVGEKAVEEIMAARDRTGGFRSLFHFCESVDLRVVNRAVIEALVKCGAFDSTGALRAPLLQVVSQAIERAIEENADPEALRGAVENYTAAAWRDDHLIVFEKLLYPPRVVPELPDWKGRAGVYYVAFGPPSREVAREAIKSFKKFMPNVPVCLVSDRPLGAGEDIFIEQPDQDIGGRIAKIRIDELAPKEWQYILYLDADTEITADISFLFQVLADGWEFTICKNPAKYHVIREMRRPDNQEETAATFAELGTDMALQLNGGVFAYRRNENTARFFRLWLEEWNRWGARDQAALHRALWRCPLQLIALGSEWNTVTRYYPEEMSAGIVHRPMTARRWKGRIDDRLDSPQAWEAVKRWEAEAR